MTRFLLSFGMFSVLTSGAYAQVREPRPEIPATGTQVFRGLLDVSGVKATDESALNREGAGSGLILIVIGVTKQADDVKVAEWSRKILGEGGAVLIATEDAASLADFFPDETPLSVVGEKAFATRDTSCFAGDGWAPFIFPVESGFDLGFGGPPRDEVDRWFNQMRRVATNRPSGLSLAPGKASKFVHPVGRLPLSTRINGPNGQPWPESRALMYAGGGRRDDPHRCCVIADTSVFINQAMWAPDPLDRTRLGTDNLAFSSRLIDWLRGPQKRSACLFVENGDIVTSFDEVKFRLPGSEPEVPPITQDMLIQMEQKLVDAANKKLAETQMQDKFNRFLTGTPPNDRFPRLLRALAVLGSLLLVGWLFRRSWKSRHAPEVPPVPKPAGTAANAGTLDERGAELSRLADLSGPIREYVRLMFVGQGLPSGRLPRKMPQVEVTGSGASQLRQYLRELWDLAFPAQAVSINFARWKELEPMLEAVRRAAVAGRWRFTEFPAPPPAPTSAPGGAA